MADAKLRQKGIDRSNLYSGAPAAIPQLRGLNVIVAIGNEAIEAAPALAPT